MLVLSRKILESVVVGGGGSFLGLLKVTVLKVTRGKVKLGFEVAADIPVRRLEMWTQSSELGELECRENRAGDTRLVGLNCDDF